VAIAAAIAVTLSSCRSAPPAPKSTIRVGYSGDTDFGDLPSVLAHEALEADGYRIDVSHLGAPDLMADALARGRIDIAIGSIPTVWAAVARGAAVRTIMGHSANPHRLVVPTAIARCDQLQGRRLALHSEGAVSTALVRAYLRDACPATTPSFLFMPESTSRASAMLTGVIDAAALEVSSVLWLESQAPDRFHVLSDFSSRWPLIATIGVHVNVAYAAAHKDDVVAYVRARLAANRRVDGHPDLLVEIAARELGPSPAWRAAADRYLADHAWPLDGGLSDDVARRSLEFYAEHGTLSRTLAPAAVVDLAFLKMALGQRP
jgi:ABC-type nitrate/sulfonate/bicarbonate transport system substrate-binding protein